jgi:hypothetical protein
MLDLQEKVTQARSATVSLRREAGEKATSEYFAQLDSIPGRRAADFAAARARAGAAIKQSLLSNTAIASVAGEPSLDDKVVAQIVLTFDAISHTLTIPEPVAIQETKTIALALAAAAGAVGGMLGLAALLRITLDMRDLGMLLGGPIGAWLAVGITQRLGRLRLLRRIVPWIFTRPKALLGAAHSEYEKTVRVCVEQHVDGVVTVLAMLCACRSRPSEAGGDMAKAMKRIGRLISSLHQAAPESLAVVAEELIQEAKNSGFEGLEGPPRFAHPSAEPNETLIWKADLQNRYEAFGHIVEGDQVIVERPPVIFGGQVVQRGLVRKVRDRA